MKNPFIIGERIYLRALTLEDLDGNYVSWLNDPEVNKQNSHHIFPYTRESGEEYIRNAFKGKIDFPLAIIDIESDTHIGNISLNSIDYINRRCDWGIMIGEREFWGKGYSKDASFLILKHAFQSLNMLRIYSGTTEKNIPGQKLMESMGMIPEGIRRKHLYLNGEYLDIHEYGVLKEEFYQKFNLDI